MASYGMNDVKTGMKILVNRDPCVITETEYVKPGKGQAFTRIKYRNIKSGRVVELTMKATDSLEAADVMDTDMQFLYADGEYWHFMNSDSFEQVQADKAAIGDTSGGGGKPAKLETGATVRVPLFVGQDEIIKVDTRSGEYVGRVK